MKAAVSSRSMELIFRVARINGRRVLRSFSTGTLVARQPDVLIASKSKIVNGINSSTLQFGTLSLRFTGPLCSHFPSSSSNCSRKLHTSSSQLQRRDYYKILGVSKNSSAKDVKKAYYQVIEEKF